MNKKSVSPLIASILLIALTVSIGAMIISWGRQYVQQRTSCLGASVNIIKAQLDSNNNQITIGFLNIGNQRIDVTKLTAILYTSTGETYKCIYYDNDNDPTTTFTGSIPSKLPCVIVNPVDEGGNATSYVDPGKYVEYSLLFNNNYNSCFKLTS